MDIETDRLILRPITSDDVRAVLSGERQVSWAADFPADGDVVIAQLLRRVGVAEGDAVRYGHRLVIERASATVVGGVGFFGPPNAGELEIGYGIVASRRGRGYATEAVQAMLADAFSADEVAVVRANVELGNPASIIVLERNGMSRCAETGEQATYQISRPPTRPGHGRPAR